MKIVKCTFTGVDLKVSKKDIELISNDYNFVEWGYLYSPSRSGLPGRFMSFQMIEDHFKTLPQNVNMSLHVCGKGVSEFIFSNSDYQNNLIETIKNRGGRVQLNFNNSLQNINLSLLAEKIKSNSSITFIIQENKANAGVINYLIQLGVTNIAALFDSSGGRGLSGKWRAPIGIPCGYAGGLGPDNIEKELISISKVVGDEVIWIDMESKIRQNDEYNIDYMNLNDCRQVIQSVINGGFVKY